MAKYESESVLEVLTGRLGDLARAGETTTYGALAKELGLRVAELTAVLERLMEEDAARDAPFRAVVVFGRLTPGMPAPGFFLKAQALGADVSDPAALVAGHLRRLRLP